MNKSLFSSALAAVGALLVGGALAADAPTPFIPVFGGQVSGRFPELAVFRDGIPSFSVNSKMTPNPRPFKKHSEYRKKYVQRVTDRRTTPYAFEEMFANPSQGIDSEYARSGKPFFVYERMSRPPYFLPTDGCPLAKRDTYEAWKKTHPGFIAFNSLWEFDSDSNYFERFYDKIGDPTIAAELHAQFPPPDATGCAHRVRWAEKAFKMAEDFHFGEKRIFPLCSGCPGYEHIFGAMGAAGLWYEATPQSAGPWNAAAAFVRGAARQRKLDFGWYMAHYMVSFTRTGKAVKGDNAWLHTRSGRVEKPRGYHAAGISLSKRQAFYGWLVGAKYMQYEGWEMLLIMEKDGREVPSPQALNYDAVYELSRTVERGESLTPLAVLTPLAEPCNVSYANDSLCDPKSQTEIFNTLVPFESEHGSPLAAKRKGEHGCLFNSPFAGFFDVLCPDSGQPSADFAEALRRYRHVLIAGAAFDQTKFDRKALDAFAATGGKIHTYPSAECPDPAALKALLLKIQDETMPIAVMGDIQWGVNKTTAGYLVYLINNKGVTKFADEPEEFDSKRTATVTVTLKATGEQKTVTVKPGDYALVSFEGKQNK